MDKALQYNGLVKLSSLVKGFVNSQIANKADKEDIPDVSNFIEADADNLTNYYNKNTIDNALNLKVDKDGNKILTDINYSATEQEKVNAAYEIRHSHDNKTVLDSITAQKIQQWNNAEQNVNADWTAESGDAQILHKPDLSVYALAANVTKSALGIDNVDNTSDADKPISTATQTALGGKQNALTAGDNITIAIVNGVLTISADTPAPTDVQVQTAVDNYLDQNGVVFNTSAEITEVLNGN